MNIFRVFPVMLLAGMALQVGPAQAGAIGSCTYSVDCPGDDEPIVVYKRAAYAKQQAAQSPSGEVLSGEIAGSWDVVFANVTFPFEFDGGPPLNLVALALPARAVGNDRYEAPGWNREVFFIDIGDGLPRLLSATLLDANYRATADSPIQHSGQLWLVQFVLYQEIEELNRNPDFYASYPDGASSADLLFVTDDRGTVLQMGVDIYDEFDQYLYTVEPADGDRFNPGIQAYDLDEPSILYVVYYFDELIALSTDLTVTRDHAVPSGAQDPALPEDFDAADLAMSVLFEGARQRGDDVEFAYGPLHPLGYTWGEAKDATSSDSGSGSGSGALSWLFIALLMLRVGWRRLPAS